MEDALPIQSTLSRLKKLDQLDEIIAIKERLSRIEECVNAKSIDDYLDQYIPLERAIEKLGISKRHFYNLRSNGKIAFIQVGKKIYLTREILNAFMERHLVKSRYE